MGELLVRAEGIEKVQPTNKSVVQDCEIHGRKF